MSKFVIVAHATKSAFEPQDTPTLSSVDGSITGPTGPTGPYQMARPDCEKAVVTTEYGFLADGTFIFNDLNTAIGGVSASTNICVRDGTYILSVPFAGANLTIMPNATVTTAFFGTIGNGSIVEGGGTLANAIINGDDIEIRNIFIQELGAAINGNNVRIENITYNTTTNTAFTINSQTNHEQYVKSSTFNSDFNYSGTESISSLNLHDNTITGSFTSVTPLNNSQITNNLISGSFRSSAYSVDLQLSGNDIARDFTLRTSQNLLMNNNNIGEAASFDTANFGDWSGVITNNYFGNGITSNTTAGNAQYLKIDGNNISKTLEWKGQLSQCSISNNNVIGEIKITGDSVQQDTVETSIIDGNLCYGITIVCFTFDQSVITNNFCSDQMVPISITTFVPGSGINTCNISNNVVSNDLILLSQDNGIRQTVVSGNILKDTVNNDIDLQPSNNSLQDCVVNDNICDVINFQVLLNIMTQTCVSGNTAFGSISSTNAQTGNYVAGNRTPLVNNIATTGTNP